MRPQHYAERTLEVDGWPVHLVTYQLSEKWHSKADNVSPGANLAREEGASREAVEAAVLAKAKELLGRTVRRTL